MTYINIWRQLLEVWYNYFYNQKKSKCILVYHFYFSVGEQIGVALSSVMIYLLPHVQVIAPPSSSPPLVP